MMYVYNELVSCFSCASWIRACPVIACVIPGTRALHSVSVVVVLALVLVAESPKPIL